jgi:hypothetical protein
MSVCPLTACLTPRSNLVRSLTALQNEVYLAIPLGKFHAFSEILTLIALICRQNCLHQTYQSLALFPSAPSRAIKPQPCQAGMEKIISVTKCIISVSAGLVQFCVKRISAFKTITLVQLSHFQRRTNISTTINAPNTQN